MYGEAAAQLFLKSLTPGSRVLDVGAGHGSEFKNRVQKAGHEYTALDIQSGEDWESHLRPIHIHAYDGVWMSHVLEHLLDTHAALHKIHNVLRGAGVVAITVPPLKPQIVGGHVSLWNAGLLLYRLVLAGFDCRGAAVQTYGYNCSVVVRRRQIELPPLARDAGDLDALAKYLPVKVNGDSFFGEIANVNWRTV